MEEQTIEEVYLEQLLNSMYWDILEILSYNAPFNLIIGNRGGGKTYGAKKFGVNDALKNGNEFIYLRRYNTEINKSAPTFFNDLNENSEFGDATTEFKGGKYYVNDKLVGYSYALSTAKTLKSMSFPKVKNIIYDEAILDPKDYNQRYLPTEISNLLNFYETVARTREGVRVFILGNNLSLINPFTNAWDLKPPTNKKKIRLFHDGFVLFQLVEKKEFIEYKESTRFGKFINGTKDGDFITKNTALRDNDNLISQRPDGTRYLCTLTVNSLTCGVWYSYGFKEMYVTDSYDIDCSMHYVLDKENHKKGTQYVKALNDSSILKMFVRSYRNGEVSFDSLKTKNIIIEALRTKL